MKKNILRVSAFLLAVIVSLTCVQCSFFAAETTTLDFVKDCKTGDIIKFGSYPQGEVYDIDLIASLDTVEKNWISYNYYSGDNILTGGGMTPSDFMKYADFEYNGETYRAVTFSKFRPTQTSLDNSDEHVAAHQNKYGYECGQVYYFKYEPLKWRVLDPANGLIMCASVIDSQPLNNYYIYAKMPNTEYGNSLCWADPELTVYSADYTKSDLRTWLNDDFYKSAFSALERSKILTSAIDNSPKNKQITEDVYVDYPETNDKVFLLSYSDVLNESYGFNPDELYEDDARVLTPTDYAKCQGIVPFDGTDSTEWRLRTASGDTRSEGVYFTGAATGGSFSYSTFDGVVPAIAVNPEASLTRAEKGDIDEDGLVNSNDALMALQHSVELRELNSEQKQRADIDNDELINASDALLILRYSVGLDEGFGYPPENTEPETPANKYALNSTDKAQILEYYKSIYRHNAGRRFSKTLEIKDFNSGDDLTPISANRVKSAADTALKNSSTKTDPFPGKPELITADDWKSAYAVDDGKYTSLIIYVAEQTDVEDGVKYEGSCGRSIGVFDGTAVFDTAEYALKEDTYCSLNSIDAEIEYKNPTIVIKVDNETGDLVKNECLWSCTANVLIKNANVTYSGTVDIANVNAVVENKITY